MPPKHTSTPWRIMKKWPNRVENKKGLFVCDCSRTTLNECVANAAFIVRAVNCHEEFVQSFENIMNRIYAIQSQTEESRKITFEYVWDLCQKAIAKAEGK